MARNWIVAPICTTCVQFGTGSRSVRWPGNALGGIEPPWASGSPSGKTQDTFCTMIRCSAGRAVTCSVHGALLTVPNVAVIDVLPICSADTVPHESTAATPVSDQRHSTSPVTSTALPSESVAVAANEPDCPTINCAGPLMARARISTGGQLGTQMRFGQSSHAAQLETQAHWVTESTQVTSTLHGYGVITGGFELTLRAIVSN